MNKKIDYPIGEKVGRLTYLGEIKNSSKYRKGIFECICGTQKALYLHCVFSGDTQSCGCILSERQAAAKKYPKNKISSTYSSYCNAKNRCENSKSSDYPRYGGRGIKFCFKHYDEFLEHLGERPKGKTLDRIDNNGHYEIGNVRWATIKEQSRNRRSCVQYPDGRYAFEIYGDDQRIKQRLSYKRMKGDFSPDFSPGIQGKQKTEQEKAKDEEIYQKFKSFVLSGSPYQNAAAKVGKPSLRCPLQKRFREENPGFRNVAGYSSRQARLSVPQVKLVKVLAKHGISQTKIKKIVANKIGQSAISAIKTGQNFNHLMVSNLEEEEILTEFSIYSSLT